jgi:hypothetical protein
MKRLAEVNEAEGHILDLESAATDFVENIKQSFII